ncbi:hypothetical protein ACO2Q8_01650 [Larkinella sp. VNQ87]|uniref:hypothetical protein n=1 Tax=Larkinella sp. VNQ87 TaxID=3400921 RepID=UPI003C08A1EA
MYPPDDAFGPNARAVVDADNRTNYGAPANPDILTKPDGSGLFQSTDSVATQCLFLASDEAATLTGAALSIDGGRLAQ